MMPIADQALLAKLTPREQAVASCVCEGLSDKEIAGRLNMAKGTVKVHMRAVFMKWGVHKRTTLIAAMYRLPERQAVTDGDVSNGVSRVSEEPAESAA